MFADVLMKRMENGAIYLELEKYNNKIVEIFGTQDANTVDSPLTPETKLEKETELSKLLQSAIYHSVTGKLNCGSRNCDIH